MDANTQTILALAQQNARLMQEVADLKAELAKYQSAPASSKPKTVRKSKKTETEAVKTKNPAHVETGKRLALWNAALKKIREEFMDAAKCEGEW
jgi:hypothetical protein